VFKCHSEQYKITHGIVLLLPGPVALYEKTFKLA
jgi:hypothetical protein